MKLINILKEIKVQAGNVFPSKYLENLSNLTDGFGEGTSNLLVDEPLTEVYDTGHFAEWGEDETPYPDFRQLIENLAEGTYVTNDSWMSFNNFPCPGAPKGAYALRVEIYKTKPFYSQYYELPLIAVSTPYSDETGEFSMGWFDASGKYYGYTKHFNNDVVRIA
jgi:hypothetical protein